MMGRWCLLNHQNSFLSGYCSKNVCGIFKAVHLVPLFDLWKELKNIISDLMFFNSDFYFLLHILN